MGGFGLNLGSDYKKVYFIGIGGVHMSGLAELLHLYGYEVSGSDARESAVLERLRNLGIPAAAGHDSANVSAGTDLVVITSAVKKENPELARAYELDIPVVSRAALLGGIMKNYKRPVCVSGSHGKTTVTTMIAEILLAAGRNPTVMNGGFCPSTGTTMINGGADFFVVEADEYCDAFLSLNPHVGVILNIEMDHADYFKDFDDLTESFRRFAALVDDGGLLVAYKDFFSHKGHKDKQRKAAASVSYGSVSSEEGADYQASNIDYDENGFPSFDVLYRGVYKGRVKLAIPGEHNIGNALAAIAACAFLEVGMDEIIPALAGFKGAARRFERKGSFNGIPVVDDYAHHPTEIRASLAAAKHIESAKRVVCVFQPHTRSRTKELFADFTKAFADADKLVFMDIFTPAGREEGHIGISSQDLADALIKNGKDAVVFGSFSDAADYLRKSCRNGDLVITMGAGDVYKVADLLIVTAD